MRNEVNTLGLIETCEVLVKNASVKNIPVESSSIKGGEIGQLIENKDLNFSDRDNNY